MLNKICQGFKKLNYCCKKFEDKQILIILCEITGMLDVPTSQFLLNGIICKFIIYIL